MSEFDDLRLGAEPTDPADLLEPPGQASAPPPPAPVVVIQYRNRGLPWYLLVPLVPLLSLGTMVGYHFMVASRARLRTAERPADPAPPSPPAVSPAAAAEAAARELAANPPPMPPPRIEVPAFPLSLNSQPLAPGEAPIPPPTGPLPGPTGLASEPAPPPDRPDPASPKREEKGMLAVGFRLPSEITPGPPAPAVPGPADRPGKAADDDEDDAEGARPSLPTEDRPPPAPAAARPEAEPAPPTVIEPEPEPPSREEMDRKLREEALAKRAALAQMRDLKERAGAEAQVRARLKLEEDRLDFRRSLADILRARGADTGDEIQLLCRRYSKGYDEQTRRLAIVALARLPGRTAPEKKVQMLRELGVPEVGILDFVANQMHRQVNSRNGPRDRNQVLLAAARVLLSRYRLPAEAARPDRDPAIDARSSAPATR